MFSRKRITFKQTYELFLISCGDAGEEIGKGIINSITERGAVVNSLLITSGKIKKKEKSVFDHRLSIDDRDGFSKKIDDTLDTLKNKRVLLKEYIEKVIPKKPKQLLIVTTGPGGTGLGSTLKVLQILYEDFKQIPPVFTLLPEVFENSRVQYNTAKFLYDVIYRKENYGNSVIILDNKPSMDELDKPFSKISNNRIELIPDAIGDLLFSSFQKSIAADFDANEDDLMEVIHTPGISVFVVEELQTDGGDTSTRLLSIIIDSVIKTTSLTNDQVFDARNAYISISNIDYNEDKLSRQTEFEANKIYKEFRNRKPFIKFVRTKDDEGKTVQPMLHAIIAGLPVSTRIIQIMQLGRDTRKEILFREHMLKNEIISLDIDKVTQLDNTLKNNFSTE